jgi:hypothetical protein
LGINGGDLVRAEVRATAERHVLLRVRHAWKTGGRLVAAGYVILLDGDDWRQRVANDYDLETVVKRGADYVAVLLGRGESHHQDHRKQQHYSTQEHPRSNYPPVLLCDHVRVFASDKNAPVANAPVYFEELAF